MNTRIKYSLIKSQYTYYVIIKIAVSTAGARSYLKLNTPEFRLLPIVCILGHHLLRNKTYILMQLTFEEFSTVHHPVSLHLSPGRLSSAYTFKGNNTKTVQYARTLGLHRPHSPAVGTSIFRVMQTTQKGAYIA